MAAFDCQVAGASSACGATRMLRQRLHRLHHGVPSCKRVCVQWLVHVALLAAAHLTAVVAASTTAESLLPPYDTIDFESLTWSQWTELHASAATAMALERVYRFGPRVRAKVLVATHISMNEFLAGDAIFRQQLGEIVGTSAARVQLEFLETTARYASDRGAYSAAFGISALPDPLATNNSMTLADAVERERERIVTSLRFGSIVRDRNVTTASLSLFGTAVQLVDVALDGETFYPIDLSPWVSVRLAVMPAVSSSGTTTPSTSLVDRYTPSRDAYQSLRLRFLIAELLQSLHIATSDIVVRESLHAPPLTSYYTTAASVVELEVHAHDERFRVAIEGYLRSVELLQAFSIAEPQWSIAAIDVDQEVTSKPLPSPSTDQPPPTTTAITSSVVELAFTFANVSLARVESRQWRVLEQVAALVASAGCTGCRVSIARVTLVSVVDDDALALGSDSNAPATSDTGFSASLMRSFDPINARSMTLVITVDAMPLGSIPTPFLASLQSRIALGLRIDLCVSIGVIELNELALITAPSALCALARVERVAAVTQPGVTLPNVVDRTASFVALNMTLALSPTALNASMTPEALARNAFVLHRVRCALLVLLQQVAVADVHVQLVAATAVSSGSTKLRSLALHYRIAVQDASQRRGIAQLVRSQRLARTVATYTRQLLAVRERAVDVHADGSRRREDTLPGLDAVLVTMPPLSVEPTTAVSATNGSAAMRMYRFAAPFLTAIDSTSSSSQPSAASVAKNTSLALASCMLSSGGSATALACLSIQFTSDLDAAYAVVLQLIESSVELATPSFALPVPVRLSANAAASNIGATVPAPWIARHNGTAAAAVPWLFTANATSIPATNSTSALSLRFAFDVVWRSSPQQSVGAFALELRLALSAAGTRSLAVHKTNVVPLVAVAGGAAAMDPTSLADSQVADPFVTAELLPQTITTASATTSAVSGAVVAIRQRSIGGFFARNSTTLTACSVCLDTLTACDAALECRALATCVGSYANANPVLYASLLAPTAPVSTLDVSWLLDQCLASRSVDEVSYSWTQHTRTLWLDGLRCVSANRCAVATSASSATATATVAGIATNRSLVLQYAPAVQTLSFARDAFNATLAFAITAVDGPSSTQSIVVANVTSTNASLAVLANKLAALYSANGSVLIESVGMPTVVVTRAAAAADTNASATIEIQYFLLAASASHRSLPVVQSIVGDVAVVTTTRRLESLALVVVTE